MSDNLWRTVQIYITCRHDKRVRHRMAFRKHLYQAFSMLGSQRCTLGVESKRLGLIQEIHREKGERYLFFHPKKALKKL